MARVAPGLVDVPASRLIAPDPGARVCPSSIFLRKAARSGQSCCGFRFHEPVNDLFHCELAAALLRQAAMPVSAGSRPFPCSASAHHRVFSAGTAHESYGAYVVMVAEFLVSTLLIGSLAFAAVR